MKVRLLQNTKLKLKFQTALVFITTGVSAIVLFAFAIGYLNIGTTENSIASEVENNNNIKPVTLVQYSGKLFDKSQVLLKWVTATEIENDYFTIYKSADGVEFKEFEKINSKGSSSNIQYYSLLDTKPYSEITYYKIVQTNNDGISVDVKVIKVRTPVFNKKKPSQSFPNPFINEVTISIPDGENTEVTIMLYDIQGRLVFEKKEFAFEGQTELIISSLEDLHSGTYFVKTYRGSQLSETVKIVKK